MTNILGAYDSAMSLINGIENQDAALNSLKVSIKSNLAACHLKCNNSKLAIANANQVLAIDPNHQKAIYRYYSFLTLRLFQGMVQQGEFEKAVEFIESKKDILADTVNVSGEISKANKLKTAMAIKEKQMYSKMFA